MTTSRRQFLQYSLAAAALTACAPGMRAASGDGRPVSKKKILVLGGTGFLGPAFVTAAQARGHSLTLFNRGKTRPEALPGRGEVAGR
ncbi:twin-arginine translocation signal domain-containing protein [Archangium gephyra]|uniref:twin-arginine translocation signal domain-containing protein n=1 Tax=Archangium gephyra TaxID=48 RepID=UPI003B7A4B23